MFNILPLSTIVVVENSGLLNALVLTVLFSVLGLGILLAGYRVIDLCTPGSLGKELIDNKNVALALVVASMILGLAYIIAAAIAG
jgi:putative membrane protein